MVEIKKGKMKMANQLDRMKTFHQIDDSNYFWREKTQDVLLEVYEIWEICFYTYKENLKN